MWAFELIDVEVEFEDGGVARGINVGARLGAVTALAGGPGSGKTTAIRLLCGEIRPRYGAALVAGRDVSRAKGRELRSIRKRVGTLMDGYAGEKALVSHMTVRENVELAVHRSARVPSRKASDLAREQLGRLNLLTVADAPVSVLSAGKRRRLAFAKLLATKPSLALVDGLDSDLNADALADVVDVIRDHTRAHGTSWLITTSNGRVAEEVADEVEWLTDLRAAPRRR